MKTIMDRINQESSLMIPKTKNKMEIEENKDESSEEDEAENDNGLSSNHSESDERKEEEDKEEQQEVIVITESSSHEEEEANNNEVKVDKEQKRIIKEERNKNIQAFVQWQIDNQPTMNCIFQKKASKRTHQKCTKRDISNKYQQ